jgi:hypothetical protein
LSLNSKTLTTKTKKGTYKIKIKELYVNVMQLNCLFARVIGFYFAASHAFRLIGAVRISLLYLGGGIFWALSTQKGNPLFVFAHVPKSS